MANQKTDRPLPIDGTIEMKVSGGVPLAVSKWALDK